MKISSTKSCCNQNVLKTNKVSSGRVNRDIKCFCPSNSAEHTSGIERILN